MAPEISPATRSMDHTNEGTFPWQHSQEPVAKAKRKLPGQSVNTYCRMVLGERIWLVLLYLRATVDAAVIILLAKPFTELNFILTRTYAGSIVGRI